MARFRLALLITLSGALVCSCGGSPTKPTPTPQPLSLTCPTDVTKQIAPGDPLVATFPDPIPSGGSPPVSVTCTPASGSSFALGSSDVACTARDSAGQTASCPLHVTLSLDARLKFTRFLAFGDSITEGYQRERSTARDVFSPLIVVPTETYPYRLEQLLTQRYPTQSITVINRGVGGETTAQGRARIVETINDTKPDVLLLLEGYNEITMTSTSSIRDDLRSMVRSAQVRDVEVLLATLFQVSDHRESDRPGSHEAISALNSAIRSLAAELKIGPVVDLERAFDGDASLLGSDGLHPNAAGYDLIARTFEEAIVERYETAVETSVETPTRSRF
jgi:lysophospholipase L1-like esterase